MVSRTSTAAQCSQSTDLPGTRHFLLPCTDSNGGFLGKKVHGEENTFLSRHWLPYSTPALVPWLVKWVLYNYRLAVWKCLNELLMRFLTLKAQTTIIIEQLLSTDLSFTEKLRVKQVRGWAGRCACWLSAPARTIIKTAALLFKVNKTSGDASRTSRLPGKSWWSCTIWHLTRPIVYVWYWWKRLHGSSVLALTSANKLVKTFARGTAIQLAELATTIPGSKTN